MSSQLLLSNRDLKRKEMAGTNSAGEAEGNQRGVEFVTEKESAGVCRLDQEKQVESQRLCSSVTLCCLPLRVLVCVCGVIRPFQSHERPGAQF